MSKNPFIPTQPIYNFYCKRAENSFNPETTLEEAHGLTFKIIKFMPRNIDFTLKLAQKIETWNRLRPGVRKALGRMIASDCKKGKFAGLTIVSKPGEVCVYRWIKNQ